MPEPVIDLDYYSTVEELMEVAPEKLKEVSLSFSLIYLSVCSSCAIFVDFCNISWLLCHFGASIDLLIAPKH